LRNNVPHPLFCKEGLGEISNKRLLFCGRFNKRNDMTDRTPSRELQEHLWVFPMDYPIKLIGLAGDELRTAVLDILNKHFADFDADSLKTQPSSSGKYHSITAQLRFDELEQVHALYADLAACPLIKTAL
jgi:putative lipoic acid-binding regulatory protein